MISKHRQIKSFMLADVLPSFLDNHCNLFPSSSDDSSIFFKDSNTENKLPESHIPSINLRLPLSEVMHDIRNEVPMNYANKTGNFIEENRIVQDFTENLHSEYERIQLVSLVADKVMYDQDTKADGTIANENNNLAVQVMMDDVKLDPIDLTGITDSRPDQNKKKAKCKCKNSKCLKMYCECFATGNYCKDCSCKDCHNIPEYKEESQKAKEHIVLKDPECYQRRVLFLKKASGISIETKDIKISCNCKRTQCKKKYCDCLKAGLSCGASCTCVECRNRQEIKAILSP